MSNPRCKHTVDWLDEPQVDQPRIKNETTYELTAAEEVMLLPRINGTIRRGRTKLVRVLKKAGVKYCSGCLTLKYHKCFAKHKRERDGKVTQCSHCKDRENLYQNALRRAGDDCEIDQEYVNGLLDAAFGDHDYMLCPVFGEEMRLGTQTGGGTSDNSLTMDSLQADGYREGSVVLMSKCANTSKSNLSFAELLQVGLHAKIDRKVIEPSAIRDDEITREWCRKTVQKKNQKFQMKRDKHNGCGDLKPTDIITPHDCPICDVRMEYGGGRGRGRPAVASLDRIEPGPDGYKDATNVQIICRRCNAAKNNLNPDESFVLAEWFSIELTRRGLLLPFEGAQIYQAMTDPIPLRVFNN